MVMSGEQDFPPGHPARFDYNPASPEAIEWARKNIHPLGERDYPVDHPKAVDTPGNTNHFTWAPGVDPYNPHLEEHTGRTPAQAKAMQEFNARQAEKAQESQALAPISSAVANEALAAERARLKVDALTEGQTRRVLAKLQEPQLV